MKKVKLGPIDRCVSCKNCYMTEHKWINLPMCRLTGKCVPLAPIEICEECPLEDFKSDDLVISNL
jgi:hypothetical protein